MRSSLFLPALPAIALATAGLLLLSSPSNAQNPISKSVYFDTDQAELKPEARQTLDNLLNQVFKLPDFDISIEAYTDDQGTAEYNKSLAERRAASVHDFLSAHGCKPRKVALTPVGKSSQQRGKSIAENRRLNRRVDVTVIPNRLDDFRELSEKASFLRRDEFTLAPGQEAVFTSASGAMLTVPANALVLPNGKMPDGPATIQFLEASQPADWVFNHLSTHTTDGQLLQTAGMFHIEASAGGQKLRLREGASLSLSIPSVGATDPEMEIFYGVRDARSGAVAWEPAVRQETLPDVNPGFGMNHFAWRRYRLLDSLKTSFSEVKYVTARVPVKPVFSDERLRRSWRRAPRQPVLRVPVQPEQPVARATFAENPDEKKALEKKDKEALKTYKKAMKRYREKLADYKERWAKYRADSTAYEKSRLYREECLNKLSQYENDLYTYCLKGQFNGRVASMRTYLWYNNFDNGMKGVSQAAHWSMLRWDYLKERNKLRRQMRQPLIPGKCSYRYLDDGSYVRYCDDPDEKAWIEKGNAMLSTLCESSGYNRVYAAIKEQYDLLLEEAKQKATENVQNLASYSFEVSQLGWINVDKFYKYPETERAPVVVNESAGDTRVYVIVKEFRSALALSYSNGRFVSPPLPKGTPVTVVALKLREGSPQLLLLDMKAGESPTQKAVYETLTLKELQEKMAQLNS